MEHAVNIAILFCSWTVLATGSIIEFTTTHSTINSLSADDLTFRCSLNDTGTINGRRDVDHTDTDIQHVTSIVVTRNGTIVASISQYSNATAVADLSDLEVTGDLTGAAGERGFLQLRWMHPSGAQAGEYLCRATTINEVGRHVLFSKALNISEIVANFDDVINFTRNQQGKIKDLEEKSRIQESTIHSLEVKNQQQAALIHDLQAVNQQQDNSILYMHMDTQQQETSIQELRDKSKHQNTSIQNIETANKNQEASISKLQADLQQQQTVIHDLKTQSQLQATKLQNQESFNQGLNNKITQIMGMLNNQNHVESGLIFCGPSSTWSDADGVWHYKNVAQNFSKAYSRVPIVHLSFAYINSPSNVHSVYASDLVSVTTSGFVVRCRTIGDRITGMDIRWTSLENTN